MITQRELARFRRMAELVEVGKQITEQCGLGGLFGEIAGAALGVFLEDLAERLEEQIEREIFGLWRDTGGEA